MERTVILVQDTNCATQTRGCDIREESVILQTVRSAVLSWNPGLAHLYRLLRDKRAALAPPVTTAFGFTLAGDKSMSDPNYEKEDIDAFLRNLEKASLCLDIGANVGLYSCLAANVGKKVIAIEPLPRNLELLHRNLTANGFTNVEVLPIGLSGQSGSARLFGTGGCASFKAGWAGSSTRLYQTITVSTLDSIVMGLSSSGPFLIKLDVEGFELEVLSGAMQTLKPLWLVEICLNAGCVTDGLNRKFLETFEVFWKHGYQASTPQGGERVLHREEVIRWAAQGFPDFGGNNYIFSEGWLPTVS
jgi:FkbM family methyltransferase